MCMFGRRQCMQAWAGDGVRCTFPEPPGTPWTDFCSRSNGGAPAREFLFSLNNGPTIPPPTGAEACSLVHGFFPTNALHASTRRMESPSMSHSCNHADAITCPHGWVPIRRPLRQGRAETYNTKGSCAHGFVLRAFEIPSTEHGARTALGFVAHIRSSQRPSASGFK